MEILASFGRASLIKKNRIRRRGRGEERRGELWSNIHQCKLSFGNVDEHSNVASPPRLQIRLVNTFGNFYCMSRRLFGRAVFLCCCCCCCTEIGGTVPINQKQMIILIIFSYLLWLIIQKGKSYNDRRFSIGCAQSLSFFFVCVCAAARHC